MVDVVSPDQEQQVKQLKRLLEGWRMAILPLKSVILWEQQWHPCAIFGAMSVFFFIIWLMDLNFLTAFALVGLIINFVDFIVPIICNSFYNAWTGQNEKTYEEICRSIVAYYNVTLYQIYSFYSLRETSPLMYYVISIVTLLLLAWVTAVINNTLLVYMISTFMMLWPGVRHRGIVNTLVAFISKAPKAIKGE